MDSLNLAYWQWFDLDICQAKPMSCRKPKRTTWESLKTWVANKKITRLIAESVEIDCRYWTNSFIPVIAHTWMHCLQAVCLTEQQPSRQMCSHVKLRWCHFPWVMSLLQLHRHSADSKKEKSPLSHFFFGGVVSLSVLASRMTARWSKELPAVGSQSRSCWRCS